LNKYSIIQVLEGEKDHKDKLLTQEEWEIIEELIKILDPFEEATEKLSGDQYPTISFLFVMVHAISARIPKILSHIRNSVTKDIAKKNWPYIWFRDLKYMILL